MYIFLKLLRKIRSFFRLPNTEKWLILELLATLFIVEITLRFLPFKIVMKWLGNTQYLGKHQLNELTPELRQIRYSLRRLGHYLPFIKCYNKALTARILLRRRGYASTLYIGFKKENGKLKGHAWLTSSTQMVIGGRLHKDYQVTSEFP